MAGPKQVIGDGAPNTQRVGTREELTNELAAIVLQLLDKRESRTKANKAFNSDIKDLEKKQREIATTIRSVPGMRETFQTEFGSNAGSHDA